MDIISKASCGRGMRPDMIPVQSEVLHKAFQNGGSTGQVMGIIA
jgi:hypothetical protein